MDTSSCKGNWETTSTTEGHKFSGWKSLPKCPEQWVKTYPYITVKFQNSRVIEKILKASGEKKMSHQKRIRNQHCKLKKHGTHVNPWLFHFNVWQNSLQIKKINKTAKIKIKKHGRVSLTLSTRRKWRNGSKILKENYLQSRIWYSKYYSTVKVELRHFQTRKGFNFFAFHILFQEVSGGCISAKQWSKPRKRKDWGAETGGLGLPLWFSG